MTVTAPKGFAAAGGHVGIKPGEAPDCAVVLCTAPRPAAAAAVFTRSLAPAAPVVCSRDHLEASGGWARGVVVTSGNANAATGEPGLRGARALCDAVADATGAPATEVLVCQTGLIGVPFRFEALAAPVRALCSAVATTGAAAEAAARAILTTDTVTKTHTGRAGPATIGAIAKGAAMLAPNLATMLAVVTTDAACEPARLRAMLVDAAAGTFNRVCVDGSTSTNDTVVVLASGLAGRVDDDELAVGLHDACDALAHQMVADAEGATRWATFSVTGATSAADAHRAARALAGSILVKCSLNGPDAYWGRIVAELATAGVGFDPHRVTVRYGGIAVCADGVGVPYDAAAVGAHLAGGHVTIACDLGLGAGEGAALGCDLSEAYVRENRVTS